MTKIVTTHYPISLSTLPSSWTSTTIGEATFDIQPGFASGVHNQEGRGIPHLRPMNVDREGRLDLNVVKYVSPANPLRVKFGDVLFNNTNSAELIGKTAYIGIEADLAFSNHMTRLRPVKGVDPRFMAYQLHFLWMTGYFQHRCTHHVNQASVSSTSLAESVPFAIAPTREQIRIAEEIEKQFTRLDAAVVALERVRANLRRYRAAVLKDACEGHLVPTEAELADREGRSYEPASALLERILVERRSRWETYQLSKLGPSGKELSENWKIKYPNPEEPEVEGLPRLPQGWTWATLSQLSEIQGGIQKQPSRKPIQNSYRFLRVANVLRGRLDLSDVHQIELFKGELEKLRLEASDLLIVEGNGSPSEIGRMAIWRGEIENCVHQNHIIRSRLLGGTLPTYVEAYWNSPMGASRVLNVASSTSGLYTLSVSKVGRIPIPLPPLAEQKRIVAETERRLSVTDELDSQVEANAKRSGRLRQSVLKSAFEGKLAAQDPADEPASLQLERIRSERNAKSGGLRSRPQRRELAVP